MLSYTIHSFSLLILSLILMTTLCFKHSVCSFHIDKREKENAYVEQCHFMKTIKNDVGSFRNMWNGNLMNKGGQPEKWKMRS